MNSGYKAYIKNVLVLSFFIVVPVTALSFLLPGRYFSLALPFLFPFFIAVTLISYYILLKALHKKFSRFVNIFMLMTGVKLFFFIAVIAVYLFLNKEDALAFTGNFFLLYLLYTIFETVSIIRYSKNYSSSLKKQE
jgi:hypothetical protein